MRTRLRLVMLPLLPVIAGLATPAPAGGVAIDSAVVARRDFGPIAGQTVGGARLILEVRLPAADVQGLNVYRGSRATGVRVNDQPILTGGEEGFVVELEDAGSGALARPRGTTRRLETTVEYTVEILHADGSATLAGPFVVEGQGPVSVVTATRR